MLRALLGEQGSLPTPVYVEYRRVAALSGKKPHPAAERLLTTISQAVSPIAFTEEDARLASEANESHGSGDGRGGTLNLLDLMVYAVAKRTGQPILCTGNDFAATDATYIRPAAAGETRPQRLAWGA